MKEQNNILQKTTQIGLIISSLYNFYDDEENINGDIINCKIISIKIYTGKKKEKDFIAGLEYTLKNIYTGKTIVMSHKNNKEYEDMKELKIKTGEYLTGLNVYFNSSNDEPISQICFSTNKGNILSSSSEQNQMQNVLKNDKNNIIIGTYGYLGNELGSIGCNYISFKDFIKLHFFKFFILKDKIQKDSKFKKNWDKKYKNLSKEYKYIWKAMNMPDGIYAVIMSFCGA